MAQNSQNQCDTMDGFNMFSPTNLFLHASIHLSVRSANIQHVPIIFISTEDEFMGQYLQQFDHTQPGLLWARLHKHLHSTAWSQRLGVKSKHPNNPPPRHIVLNHGQILVEPSTREMWSDPRATLGGLHTCVNKPLKKSGPIAAAAAERREGREREIIGQSGGIRDADVVLWSRASCLLLMR